MSNNLTRIALKISLIYALIGSLWILFSDRLVFSLRPDHAMAQRYETFKGWAFIGTTALLLYIVLHREFKHRQVVEKSLQRANRAQHILSQSNQTLLHVTSEIDLLQTVCRNIVQSGGYLAAWIGYLLQGDLQIIHPMASAGVEANSLRAMIDAYANRGTGSSPITRTLQSRTPVMVRLSEQKGIIPIRNGAAMEKTYQSLLVLPLHIGDELSGVLSICAFEPDAFDEQEYQLLQELSGDLAYGIHALRTKEEHAQAERELLASQEQLRALTARLDETSEAERKRLSQELHDRVGQTLTAISINLNVISHSLPPESWKSVSNSMADTQKLVEQAAVQIRNVMAELRPPVLDDFGLVTSLGWYCDQFSQRTGIEVNLIGQPLEPRLPPSRENALFRIVQEALTNISKHSQATRASVIVLVDEKTLTLKVMDDGLGFDPEQHHSGWGLNIMRERAQSVGGELSIASEVGIGTTLTVCVPLT